MDVFYFHPSIYSRRDHLRRLLRAAEGDIDGAKERVGMAGALWPVIRLEMADDPARLQIWQGACGYARPN